MFNKGNGQTNRADFVENALEPIKNAALDEEERYWAQRMEEHRWDIASYMSTSFNQGREEALEQGVQQRTEQIIRSMIQNGMNDQTILSIVGEKYAVQIKPLLKKLSNLRFD